MKIGGGGRPYPTFDKWRTPLARVIARRTLDLDDRSTEIAEHLPGPGASQHARELENLQARKRRRHQENA
jgi:hypothetical protein